MSKIDHLQTPWTNLRDLPINTTYKIVETWTSFSRYFPGETKISVILKDEDNNIFGISANRKLTTLLKRKTITTEDDGWCLFVGETVVTNNGYKVVNVQLEQLNNKNAKKQ